MRANRTGYRARAAFVAAALLTEACSTGIHYRPDAPIPATVAGIGDVELLEIEREPYWTEMRLRWRAAPGIALTNAFLAPPEAAPCSGGVAMAAVVVDGQQRWDRPVGLGADHLITMQFSNDSRVAVGPMMADVAVAVGGTERCARFVVTAPDRRLNAVSPLRAQTIELSLAGQLRLPSDDALTFAAGWGRWLGPLRLTLAFGITLGSARVNVGGTTESSRTNLGVLFVAPEAAVFPVVGARHALGVSASYMLGSGYAKTNGPNAHESDDSIYGPRVSLQLVWITPPPLGAPRAAPLMGRALALFLARQSVWPGQAERGVAYVGGLGFVTTFSGGDWW